MSEITHWTRCTIPEMLQKSAFLWGERTAIITEEGRSLSFEDLYRKASDLAAGFLKMGIQKGDHVATLLGTGPTYIIASHALMMAGAVVVPINFNFQAEEIAQVMGQSESRYLLVEDEIHGRNMMETIERALFKPLERSRDSRFQNTCYRGVKDVIVKSISGRKYSGTISMEEVFIRGKDRDRSFPERMISQLHPDDIAFIMYTSGSTAFPKGALRTHGSSLGIAYYITVYPVCLNENDMVLVYSPFFHIGGCVYNTLGPHLCGCPILLMSSFDPGKALELIEKYRVTFVSGFETHFYRLTNHPRFPFADLSSVSKVRLATGPYWYERLKELGMGREFIAHHYGFTEGTGVVMPPDEKDEDIRKNANGRPFPGVELKIVDPETGRAQPARTPGEICLRGWTLFKGYYGMPEETRASMDDEGFFHTGDYGWMDEKGYLYYRGRYKQMIKSGGENVSQREVELFLEGHPEIQAVQVIGLPDPEWGELVSAVIQTRSGRAISVEEVREFCKGKLAGFKIPKRIFNIKEHEWPVTQVGKVEKALLRKWAMEKMEMNKEDRFH